MLLKRRILDGIAEGRISLAFRRWKRPTVKPGGTLRTAIGVLAIDAVDVIAEEEIMQSDARRAGFASRSELVAELNAQSSGQIYRIVLRYAGADPRQELLQLSELSDDELINVTGRLDRMDAASKQGPWTFRTLELIARNPGQRATELAESLGEETKRFKNRVRRLKELGLTESLKVGYRLSPRGETVLKRLQS